MSLSTQIYALLNGATQAGIKVFPLAAPDQTKTPFITYQRVTAISENVLDGSNVSLINTRVQFDIFSKTYSQAQSIFTSLDAIVMAGFEQITSIHNQDIYEAEVDIYRVLAEYSIWHPS